ncbi:MAG: molybdate ABC transporter substrate-binding protein [Lachnospiraceae bacterium]|nr:molybdate ABC transporter substrate-binding protein [Lachnospiraceae bacterium]
MKKTIALIITAILVFGMLVACGKKEDAPQDGQSAAAPSGAIAARDTLSGELNIYAAASMTESLDKVIGLFNAQHPNVTVNANYQSSGDLVKAIKAGGVCDIFISAGAKQMNQIDITADAEINTDGSDFVVPGTRFKMLQNKCVLVVPDDNPAGLTSFADLKAAFDGPEFLFAKGGADVPVGEYTTAIFEYLGIDEAAVESKINYCENVKAVQAAVKEATNQAGVVYATDAYSAGLQVIDTATDEMTGKTVIYPAAQITTGENPDAAAAFMEFMMTPEATACFEEVGFTVLK